MLGCPGMDAEKLNPDNLPALVEVENDAWPHLFCIDNGALIESEIQGIACFIDFQPHVCSLVHFQ